MAGYAKTSLISTLGIAINDISNLYKEKFINYRGKTISQPREQYSEVISGFLLNNLQEFKKIKSITREKCYFTKTHDGKIKNPNSNRTEEKIALSMSGKTYQYIGKIVDYQIPLKNKKDDTGLGKIDLLSYIDDKLIILELKVEDSKETLLRCVLETYTYWKTVDQLKLLRDFSSLAPEVKNVEKAVLVFKNSFQHEEYKNTNSKTRELMTKLDVGIYLIEHINENRFIITLP